MPTIPPGEPARHDCQHSVGAVCVDVVARYGGKPPLYTVVIRCAEKEPIRQKLSRVLNRPFSLGGSSFALSAGEAQRVLQFSRPEASAMPEVKTRGS